MRFQGNLGRLKTEKDRMSAWKKVSTGASIVVVTGIFLFIFVVFLLFFAVLAVVGLYITYKVYRHYRPRSNTIAKKRLRTIWIIWCIRTVHEFRRRS